MKYPKLTQQDHAYFYTSGIRGGIEIDTNAVKWNKTIDGTDTKPDRKKFFVKRELEDSDDKDQLYIKKLRSGFHSPEKSVLSASIE